MSPPLVKEQIPFLKLSNAPRAWSEGWCEICETEDVRLSLDRAPPKQLHMTPKPAPPRVEKEVPARRTKDVDPYLNTINAAIAVADSVSAFKQWLRSPPPPPPATLATARTAKAPPAEKVPVFDLQDVPKAMRKLGMPVGAKLQERWFAGESNFSQSTDDLRDEINQNGLPYAPDMVDETTVKIDWVLSFGRAQKAYDELIKTNMFSVKAIENLAEILRPYGKYGQISTWNRANSNLLEFHRKFQFERITVDARWAGIFQQLRREAHFGGVPDDLTAALGAFNLYIAPRYVRFDEIKPYAFVEQVSVYVRDAFEFSDTRTPLSTTTRSSTVVRSHCPQPSPTACGPSCHDPDEYFS